MPSSRPAPQNANREAIAALRDDAEQVALRLSGDDIDSDLQELGEHLARLEASCDDLAKASRGTWKTRLTASRKHFHEARDLLDDGEPADAVALEVMAGREGLRN
ncbi:MAG: hypothetical protein ABR598_01590 [Candidatus Dormibacteria bacterium]